MAYKLIRANSDTPNIYNKDDVRMIRYAYNGYSGYIPKIGGELGWNYDNEAGVFSLSSGLLVLEGWEVYIDEEGWKWNIPLSTGVFSVSIYLSLNALANIVKIEGKYSTDTNYPEIEPGDDLSANPDGSANLLLYTFVINNSTIQDVRKQVKPIPRLDSLFEENRTTIKNATTSINSANVTSKINDKNITDIFEEDGTTAKVSTDVTSTINGNNITDIFEEDGTTAKVSKKVSGKNVNIASNTKVTITEKGVYLIFFNQESTYSAMDIISVNDLSKKSYGYLRESDEPCFVYYPKNGNIDGYIEKSYGYQMTIFKAIKIMDL